MLVVWFARLVCRHVGLGWYHVVVHRDGYLYYVVGDECRYCGCQLLFVDV